ncbi:hypothetical protein LJR296_008233 [Cupriavidus necator]|uniref:hypothetical protein n=1 Tax=Cupriavidus necator TaxID=106590 RepID=UPI003ECF5C44
MNQKPPDPRRPFEVNVRDPRIVIGQQNALNALARAGLREPGVYQCGPGTSYPTIDHAFAAQFQSMTAPHPSSQAKPAPGAPTWLVGPQIFQIVSPRRPDPWRHPVSIQLNVRLVGTVRPDADNYSVSDASAKVYGVPQEVSATLQALQRHGYADAGMLYTFNSAELATIGVTPFGLQKLVTTGIPRAQKGFARVAAESMRSDEYGLELNINLVP